MQGGSAGAGCLADTAFPGKHRDIFIMHKNYSFFACIEELSLNTFTS
jgi:hypothetical protein